MKVIKGTLSDISKNTLVIVNDESGLNTLEADVLVISTTNWWNQIKLLNRYNKIVTVNSLANLVIEELREAGYKV